MRSDKDPHRQPYPPWRRISRKRAVLAFLVARTVLDEGHAVPLFLAGDAVELIRDPVLDSLRGLDTGTLRELFDAIVARGARFHLSGMSSSARGLTDVWS